MAPKMPPRQKLGLMIIFVSPLCHSNTIGDFRLYLLSKLGLHCSSIYQVAVKIRFEALGVNNWILPSHVSKAKPLLIA